MFQKYFDLSYKWRSDMDVIERLCWQDLRI